jgi:hypothetical protein
MLSKVKSGWLLAVLVWIVFVLAEHEFWPVERHQPLFLAAPRASRAGRSAARSWRISPASSRRVSEPSSVSKRTKGPANLISRASRRLVVVSRALDPDTFGRSGTGLVKI